jgi:bifunctional UDP-N-acetylglucosamine pyrophosphorylase/glucosamine-1-phosphate N-acetyltransferase
MRSDRPKVLHEICGRPMLSFVLNACRSVGVDRLLVVVGHGREEVRQAFDGDAGATWVQQEPQQGTGHAVLSCRKALEGFAGSVLVIAGDMPLVRRETLSGLLSSRQESGCALSLATTTLEDPTGYGRIIRNSKGELDAIVEQRDCTPEQRRIREVNPSYYCFDAAALFRALDRVAPDPATGEWYLTHTVRILKESGEGVSARVSLPAEEAMGINSRLDLAVVGRAMQDRIQLGLMQEGVTIVDPDNTWIDADATVGRDTTIYPFSFLGAACDIGAGCRIGPFAHVPAGETVEDGTVIGPMIPGDIGAFRRRVGEEAVGRRKPGGVRTPS